MAGKPGAAPPAGKRVSAYYPNYAMYNGYEPGAIPFSRVSNVNYAFAYVANGSGYYTNPKYYPAPPATGTCVQSDTWGDLQKPLTVRGTQYHGGYAALNRGGKSVNPKLKTLLSIGGYQQITGAGPGDVGDVPWSLVTANAKTMRAFVDSCVSLAWNNGFDGIDIDWEFPTSADTANYAAMIKMFREKLGGAPLTIAAPPDPGMVTALGGSRVDPLIDWVNVMAYDFFGPWPGATITGTNAPLTADPDDPSARAPALNDTSLIGTYLASGFSPGKLLLGMPFYGHDFAGVPERNNGLYQAFTDPGPAGPVSKQPGTLTYSEIVNNYSSYPKFRVTASQVPYAYDTSTAVWISYDDPTSIGVKASFAARNKLGGAMIWDLSGDHNHDLLDSINANIG